MLKTKHYLLFLALFSGFLFFLSAYLNYKNSQELLKNSYFSKAQSIALVINTLIKNLDIKTLKPSSHPISELLSEENWEIAYIAILDTNGTYIFHTYPEFIGRKDENFHSRLFYPEYYFSILETGEKIFVYENLSNFKDNFYIIRIGLYTYFFQKYLKTAKFYLIEGIILGSLILLIGFILYFYLDKTEKYKKEIEEFQKLYMLSRTLSHEIKNPLASIKGFTQYLLKKLKSSNYSKQLEIILKETKYIEKLISELILYSHPLKVNLFSFDLKNLVGEIFLSFKTTHSDILWELKIKGKEFIIVSDPEKIKQIITYLIDNAVKSLEESTDERRIKITLEEKIQFYFIEIKDTGPGIPKDIKDRIWEPFFTTRVKGTGLGLAIVKKLATILKIRIFLETKENKGTKVCLYLPKSLS